MWKVIVWKKYYCYFMAAAITGYHHSVFWICFCAILFNTFLKKIIICVVVRRHFSHKCIMLCFKVCCMCLPVLSFYKAGWHWHMPIPMRNNDWSIDEYEQLLLRRLTDYHFHFSTICFFFLFNLYLAIQRKFTIHLCFTEIKAAKITQWWI